MAYSPPTAVEIDKKLRDDFRRRLKDFGISAETADPVLAVLFRTFAGQLESLYSETERIRLALLDELIAVLGIEKRAARPAQTIVRFLVDRGSELIQAGTELLGEAQTGERLTFTTDAAITASAAHIAFGLAYQDGALQFLPAIEMADAIQAARPSLEPLRVNLGPNPAVFLAVEDLPAEHLSWHGLFFELGPDAAVVQDALKTASWCLIGRDGELGAAGILRPARRNAGVLALEWLLSDRSPGQQANPDDEADAPKLPDGFYAGRTFVFPVVPLERRLFCRVPKAMESAMARLFGRASAQILERPRAWLRIALPRQVPKLQTAISGLWLHAVSASNVECFNETIRFDEHGTSIPISREAGTAKHLVAPLSVIGEAKSQYLPEFEPCADPDVGRYSIRNGRIEIWPPRFRGVQVDTYANLRLWITSGSIGNGVGPGKVQAFLKSNTVPSLRISNPTAAAGGSDGESLQQAQARFAAALLSRDRVVTRADLINAVHAFDRRILGADVSTALERTAQGLRRVQRVRCEIDRNDFLDPDEEIRVLREELMEHLGARVLYDTALALELNWQ